MLCFQEELKPIEPEKAEWHLASVLWLGVGGRLASCTQTQPAPWNPSLLECPPEGGTKLSRVAFPGLRQTGRVRGREFILPGLGQIHFTWDLRPSPEPAGAAWAVGAQEGHSECRTALVPGAHRPPPASRAPEGAATSSMTFAVGEGWSWTNVDWRSGPSSHLVVLAPAMKMGAPSPPLGKTTSSHLVLSSFGIRQRGAEGQPQDPASKCRGQRAVP